MPNAGKNEKQNLLKILSNPLWENSFMPFSQDYFISGYSACEGAHPSLLHHTMVFGCPVHGCPIVSYGPVGTHNPESTVHTP